MTSEELLKMSDVLEDSVLRDGPKKGTSQRRKWADGGHMESQQEVKARWFPHVVLATVKISLPSTYTPNRCCFCVSVSSLYLTSVAFWPQKLFKIHNSVVVGAWTILFFSIKWAEVEYVSFFFPPPPDFFLCHLILWSSTGGWVLSKIWWKYQCNLDSFLSDLFSHECSWSIGCIILKTHRVE